MPKRSSISAKKTRQENRFILELKDARRRIKKFPEIKKVLLFGSRARGDWGLKSDADVLVILKKSQHKRFFDRIPRYLDLFSKVSLPIDIFPYTQEEFDRMQKEGNKLILRVLKEGIPLS
jgi:predicted nucleotidyltransferase